MPTTRALAVTALALAAVFPAAAQAGTVTRTGTTILYQGAGGNEDLILGVEGAAWYVDSSLGAAAGSCTQNGPNRVECPASTRFDVTTLAGNDSIDATRVTGAANLVARSGAGGDYIDGTANADILAGEGGDDTLWGHGGDDTLDGGSDGDSFYDGAGNDTVLGGPGNDIWYAEEGTDSFAGGDGDDTVDYGSRTQGVTIILNGAAVSGAPGENDTVGADVEAAYGGSGPDRIIGNDLGDRLRGNGGNDVITGGRGEDRVEGGEGDDTIDTRDGRFDSIDCGPGTDTLLADPGDSAENCEIAPDRDGDGHLNEADCQPDNPAIFPGAGEIVGNAVDEDCDGKALYLRVSAPSSYATQRRGDRARFTRFVISELRRGDTIELRCSGGKKKGCPFTRKTIRNKQGRYNIAPALKKRFLSRGAVLEVRVTRANEIGRVQRLTVGKRGVVKSRLLCLNVGASRPGTCA